VPPQPGSDADLAVLSIADRDKAGIARLASALARAGYRFAATAGTRRALAAAGYDALEVARIGEPGTPERPAILDLIDGGSVRLVVNTPTPRSGPVRDAAEIRHGAIEAGVLCLTAIETAVAAAEALDRDVVARLADVRPLGEWLAESSAAPDAVAPALVGAR
jgi:carbamoyl-phosphate synthase large subunit